MADALAWEDPVTLFCGVCRDSGRGNKVLGKMYFMNGIDDPTNWALRLRLKSPIGKSERSVETTLLAGENHRWMDTFWHGHDSPVVLDGCGRHVVEKNRTKLTKVITRAHRAGGSSVYVTG